MASTRTLGIVYSRMDVGLVWNWARQLFLCEKGGRFKQLLSLGCIPWITRVYIGRELIRKVLFGVNTRPEDGRLWRLLNHWLKEDAAHWWRWSTFFRNLVRIRDVTRSFGVRKRLFLIFDHKITAIPYCRCDYCTNCCFGRHSPFEKIQEVFLVTKRCRTRAYCIKLPMRTLAVTRIVWRTQVCPFLTSYRN